MYCKELTQTEKRKRHLIFLCLIKELRNARFERYGDYSHIVFDLPDLDSSINFGSLNNDELLRLGVCSIPNSLLNDLVCQKLAKLFGDLSICEGFIKFRDSWHLDIDAKLTVSGLFLPIRSHISSLIYGLKVFRYPDDPNPFMLKTRRGWEL